MLTLSAFKVEFSTTVPPFKEEIYLTKNTDQSIPIQKWNIRSENSIFDQEIAISDRKSLFLIGFWINLCVPIVYLDRISDQPCCVPIGFVLISHRK